jgi:hypothetical protein
MVFVIFRNKLKRSLEEFKAAAMARPGTKTDILGTMLKEKSIQTGPVSGEQITSSLRSVS